MARDDAKRLLDEGRAPSDAKKVAKLAAANASANTFGAIAAELLEKKRREKKSVRTMAKLEWLLGLAKPVIGARPISEPLKRAADGRRPADCAPQYGQVFRYAVATGRAQGDPTGALRGALADPVVKHRAAIIEPKAFGRLLRAIQICWPPGRKVAPESRAVSVVCDQIP